VGSIPTAPTKLIIEKILMHTDKDFSGYIKEYIELHTPYADGKAWKIEEILRQFDSAETYLSLDIRAGWLDHVYQMHEALIAIVPNYSIIQIKEKFGALRYYINASECEHDSTKQFIVDSIINFGENMSKQICERCGKKYYTVSSRSFYHWTHTYCDTCELEYVNKIISNKQKPSPKELDYQKSIIDKIASKEKNNK